ncbi:MAG: glycosyltransferase family 2 protein [Acidobacteriota bacterium]|nr:glycosyltransferase family 2 protein [Acidobacteriota bacterium]
MSRSQITHAGAAPGQRQAGGRPRVLVSVLSHNSARTTVEALRCLARQTYPAYHLQLIDNASADGTPESAAREFPGLDIRALRANTGYTGGANLALRQALGEGYDYVVVCTHDVEVDETAVERLVETARARPAVGAVGGVEYNPYTGEWRASGGGSYSRWFSRMGWRSAAAGGGPEVFCVHGALVLLTAEALAAGVLLDENLFMYFDEADLGFQLRAKGLAAVVDRRVVVRHKREPRPEPAWVGYLMQRNRLYMVRKHGRWYHRAFYALFSSLCELPAKVLVRGLQGRADFARACVAGQVDGLLGRAGAGRLRAGGRRPLVAGGRASSAGS